MARASRSISLSASPMATRMKKALWQLDAGLAQCAGNSGHTGFADPGNRTEVTLGLQRSAQALKVELQQLFVQQLVASTPFLMKPGEVVGIGWAMSPVATSRAQHFFARWCAAAGARWRRCSRGLSRSGCAPPGWRPCRPRPWARRRTGCAWSRPRWARLDVGAQAAQADSIRA
jgi:hypothetical protein